MKFKKFAAAILILSLIAASLAGCGNNSPTASNKGNSVKSPAELKYLTKNQITIENIQVNKEGEPTEASPYPYELDLMSSEERQAAEEEWGDELYFDGNILEIDGLKNKEVQDKINSRIKELYLENVDRVPPYRGIKLITGENPTQSYEFGGKKSVSMYECFNYNNVLSLCLEVTQAYKSDINPDSVQYVFHEEPLNFDLNTGDELTLADMFCDDVDYIAEVNSYVSDAIASSWSDEEGWYTGSRFAAKLTGPFEGISENQKFYLTEGALTMLFDYDTPAFSTDFNSERLFMPFSDKMSIGSRFFNEDENIYTADEPWEKNFTYIYEETYPELSYEYKNDGDVKISVEGRWPEDLPKDTQSILVDLCKIDKDAVTAKLLPYMEGIEPGGDSELLAEYSKNVVVTVFGDYLAVYVNDNSRVALAEYYEDSEYEDAYYNILEEYFYESNDHEYCYKTGTDEPLQLKDIFVENADSDKLIRNALIKSIEHEFEIASKWADSPDEISYDFCNGEFKDKDEKFLDLLIDSIEGFRLSVDSIFLELSTSGEEIFYQIYGYMPESDTDRSIAYTGTIYYKDLGCDNLKLFD